MTKICLMGGAVINSGDFLLEKRSFELIRHFIPNSEITVLNRVTEGYSDKIDYLNSFDAVIFAGGPLYQPGLYQHQIPFVHPDELKRIHPPMFFLGGGIKGSVYRLRYSESDKVFLSKGIHDSVSLSCRDIYTYRFLHHQGLSAIMTGCPAWYDLSKIDVTDTSKFKRENFMNICVSEPAKELNVPLLLGLLKHLRKKYPLAKITLVNHREIKQGIQSKLSFLQKNECIEFANISGSADGFSIYDDCDLHVGFRVHAHIYNLSKRNLTILFSEDIRGAGVNQTLGLENLSVDELYYGKRKLWRDYYIMRYPNDVSDQQVIAGAMIDDYLETCSQLEYSNYLHAFETMKSTFQSMSVFFNGILKTI